MPRNTLALLLSIFVLISLVSADADAAEASITDASVEPSSITWDVSNAQGITLTVSGPDGIFRQELDADSVPRLGLLDPQGDPLSDGSYTWELRVTPKRSPGKGRVLRDQVESGYFRILDGLFVVPKEEGVGAEVDAKEADAGLVLKDQSILDDLIVDGSLCIGLDCVNGESFGADTVRLKENVLRIKLEDSSGSAGFPTNDWQLTANDSASGGGDRFSIEDVDGGTAPFTLEASAPSNSLYVDDLGRVGFGTATPAADVHLTGVSTPTVRLDQTGTSPQTWDLAGNESSFSLRDVTNGSQVPFQIESSAPADSIFVASNGNVGLGTSQPTTSLHVRGAGGAAKILVEDTTATTGSRQLFEMSNQGSTRVAFTNRAFNTTWVFGTPTDDFEISRDGSGSSEFNLDQDGNLAILGNLTACIDTGLSGCSMADVFPDYVFSPEYPLMPIEELRSFIEREGHLPNIPNAGETAESGINITQLQMKLLEKIEELTLYTLEQQESLDAQLETIRALRIRVAALEKGNVSRRQ